MAFTDIKWKRRLTWFGHVSSTEGMQKACQQETLVVVVGVAVAVVVMMKYARRLDVKLAWSTARPCIVTCQVFEV